MTDRNEALRLADELAEEAERRVCHVAMAPASLLNEAAALLRQQAERIAELEKEALAKPFAPDWAGYRQGLEDGKREGQAERDRLLKTVADDTTLVFDLCAERDKLRAEVERLRPNAERYEWLRDNLESEWAICEWQDDPDGLGYYRDARASHIVDAAIDLARTHKDTP